MPTYLFYANRIEATGKETTLDSGLCPKEVPFSRCLGKRERIVKKIFIVEDELLMVRIMESFLEWEIPDVEIVGHSTGGVNTVNDCLSKEPDLVLLDLILPEINGLDVLKEIKAKAPNTRVIVYSGMLTEESVLLAKDLGVDGILLKTAKKEVVVEAVKEVLKGEKFVDPEVKKWTDGP